MTEGIPQPLLVEYAEAFELFDVAGEGTVPVGSIDLILKSLGVAVPAASLLAMKQRKVDEGEEKVSFTEFLHLVTHGQTESEYDEHHAAGRAAALREALAMFDPSGSGFISVVDFRKSVRDVLKDSEVDALVKKADPQQKGHIAYEGLVNEICGV